MKAHDKAVLVEDLNFLADTNVGLTDAAHRTGFPTRDACEKWLRNHSELPLLTRLLTQERSAA